MIVAGDFNATNRIWSSRHTDVRRSCLERSVAELGLALLNKGNEAT